MDNKKCAQTIMIGALSVFEEKFGWLWAHGYPHEDRTTEELEWFELWQETRKEILDLGNDQISKLNKSCVFTSNIQIRKKT